MAEVDLNVICKHCGAEVSPYITECPYCGQRLRKRAPKLGQPGAAQRPPRLRLRLRRERRVRLRGRFSAVALVPGRPYATITLVLGAAIVYLVERATDLGLFDLGAVIGPLGGELWRLGAAQFVYENVGYLLAVCVAVAIFGSSLERRFGFAVPLLVFGASGAAGLFLATEAESFPTALGGNGSALGLLCAWLVRDLRDRRGGHESESDLLGVAAIAAVLALMPLLEPTANAWAAFGGAAAGAFVGLVLPAQR